MQALRCGLRSKDSYETQGPKIKIRKENKKRKEGKILCEFPDLCYKNRSSLPLPIPHAGRDVAFQEVAPEPVAAAAREAHYPTAHSLHLFVLMKDF